MITLALTGDVILGRGVAEAIDRRLVHPEKLWGDVTPLLEAANLALPGVPVNDVAYRGGIRAASALPSERVNL